MSAGLMQKQLFLCSNMDELKTQKDNIVKTVRNSGYALVRNLFDAASLREKLKTVFHYANTMQHRGTTGVLPQEIRTNMSKWSIGGHSASQANIARLMLTIYNPLFQPDQFQLHADFEKLIAVRDILANRTPLGDDQLLPTHFNACRLQLYPAGGGFMGKHTDSRGVTTLQETGHQENYIQLVLLLTQKEKDFHSGCAFVSHNNVILDSEESSLTGDVLVYDGMTDHGVADIDSDSPLNLQNLKGRVVALATIYNNR